jgi:hypothetical protein
MHEKLQQNRGRTFFAWFQGLDEVSLELEIRVDSRRLSPSSPFYRSSN